MVDVEAVVSESDYHDEDIDEDEEVDDEEEEKKGEELDFIANDVIDDSESYDDDNENEVKSKKSKTILKEEETEEKQFFWDKETHEDNAKKVNEEDSYKWEEEVRVYCTVRYAPYSILNVFICLNSILPDYFCFYFSLLLLPPLFILS